MYQCLTFRLREQARSHKKSLTAQQMTQRKPSPADSVKLAAEILPGGQHDYPTSLLAD
jgi:hypothetical protein